LKLKNEDSLFEFLLNYSKKWQESSIPLFSNLYFEYLSEENFSKFFDRFSNFPLPPSVIESLSFVFKSENRFVHKNRHFSETVLNSIHCLSEIRIQFEKLKIELSVVKSNISKLKTVLKTLGKSKIEFPPSPKDHNGLFNFLRQECDDQNPHLSKIINVSASHFEDETRREWNVLDWVDSTHWFSGIQKQSTPIWIDFNLCGRSFILNGISIDIHGGDMPQCWSLLGSDGNENFKLIYESNYDTKFRTCDPTKDVFLPIKNSKSFKRFRILTNKATWMGSYYFSIHSIEFYGQLN
jgi:hypothetical protein